MKCPNCDSTSVTIQNDVVRCLNCHEILEPEVKDGMTITEGDKTIKVTGTVYGMSIGDNQTVIQTFYHGDKE